MATTQEDRPLVGRGIERREDRRLLTGRGRFVGDDGPADTVYLALHRSRHAHARLTEVDTAPAEATAGVLAAYTWDDVDESAAPGVISVATAGLDVTVPGHPVLARDRVRYQGQPVAAVVATDRYAAATAADAVEVAYDPLESVTRPREAAESDAPAVFEPVHDNVVLTTTVGDREAADEALASAPHTVEVDLVNNRVMPSAIEPRGALARYDPREERLHVTVSSQDPHGHRADYAHTLGIPERRVHVEVPDVGGAFGHKGKHYPGDALAAWSAMELGRPVEWVATRSGNASAGTHGRDHQTRATMGLDRDGSILGIRVETHGNVGGYSLGSGVSRPPAHVGLVSGQYRIPVAHATVHSVFTNTAPVHSYRGAGRPEAVYVIERLVDVAARELGVDPVALRRHNQVPPDAFPYHTATGLVYDSGDYAAARRVALDAVGYEDLRERQRALREEDRYLGVGVACYVEDSGSGYQSGVVRVNPAGDVTVMTSGHSHGQGHGTTFAQIVADEIGVPLDDVDFADGDSDRVPTGKGTSGSRSTVLGGNAVRRSAASLARKAREIAAHHLEAAPRDVSAADGEFHVRGAPDRSMSFEAVAAEAYGGDLPEGVEPGLEATTFFEAEGTAYSFGTHVAVVEVDPSTGEFDVERYLAVDDCGERINPRLVEGQVHGGLGQGIGQARYEHAVYDENGNLVTGSFLDYAVPRAAQLPELETDATTTPSPHNPLGVKGVGEAGTTAAPPTVVNAVVDALAPFGVDHLDMPLTPESVWRAVRRAES